MVQTPSAQFSVSEIIGGKSVEESSADTVKETVLNKRIKDIDKKDKNNIMNAIMERAGINSEAQTFMFTLPVIDTAKQFLTT